MKLSIPKENHDIQKEVNRKLIRQIVFCAAWIVAASLFMAYYAYGYFAETLNKEFAVGIWTLLCLIPFVKCKCWQWFDRAYEGEVISCKQTSGMKMKSPIWGKLVRTYTQNILRRLTNNREKNVKLTWLSDDDVPFYYEGDYVRHYRGTKFMQVISDKPEVPRICVMCGTQHLPDETYCDLCKLSLIDHRK